MLPHPVLLVVLSSLLRAVYGFADGYDTAMCSSLTPSVGSPETSASPFSITFQVTKYNQGGEVEVGITASGGQRVVGFILQARKSSGSSTTPVGTWAEGPSQTKTLQCDTADDTKTHSSTIPKGSSPKFTWLAPPDCSKGSIQFHATVATGKYQYWTGIVSEELPCTTEAQTPLPSTTTTTTSSPPTDPPVDPPTEPPVDPPTEPPIDPPTEPTTKGGTDNETSNGDSNEMTDSPNVTGDNPSNSTGDNNSMETTTSPSSSASLLLFCTTLLVTCYGLTTAFIV